MVWHDETLTKLEPVKNRKSSNKNTQIPENNAYSLHTLEFDHEIASTSSLIHQQTQKPEASLRPPTTKMVADPSSDRLAEKSPG